MLKIYNAMLKVQSELPTIEKDAKNPHYKNAYATLPNVLSAVLPVLRNNGVLFTSKEIIINENHYVNLQLIHVESGELLENNVQILGASDMQKLGSAFTYATRYGLLSLLGISPDVDDDGNVASATTNATTSTKHPQAKPQAINYDDLVSLYELKKDKLPDNQRLRADEVINKKIIASYAKLHETLRGL